ncbi:cysteine desulfurase [Candidatus Uhrbacteria bacterium]|nr:cysteine desulfurase [Candidatus Uhrbacteria bacterium]
MFDQKKIKKEFPIFSRKINGKPLVYLDNASTTQKPECVLDALTNYYSSHNANIHRGIHQLSEESTVAYEAARKRVARFIHARKSDEIIFTKNCTDAINLVAKGFASQIIGKGDEIIISAFEHHSNLVPWQELTKAKKAGLKVVPLAKDLTFDMNAYKRMLSTRTKMVCMTAQSNVLGTVLPIKKIVQEAHKVGAYVLVDGAQSVGHGKTNVQSLGCDFFAFSAHKMLGPTGVGVLYGRYDLLEKMVPVIFGGDMVTIVEQHSAQYQRPPYRFEAGTPNIADVIAFVAALDYLEKIGLDAIHAHEQKLTTYARTRFSEYSGVNIVAPPLEYSGGIVSFIVPSVHPHDVATVFNQEGVAIRSGLHCAEPLVRSLGVDALCRMSFYLYTTQEDIDRAVRALQKTRQIFCRAKT